MDERTILVNEMKLLTVVLVISTLGCQQVSDIVSSDGTKDLGWCSGANWVPCVNKACPNGYDIVRPVTESQTAIIKCKDAPDAGQPGKEPK